MELVKFDGAEGAVYINPQHVVAVRKGMKDTRIETLAGVQIVKEDVDIVVRLLGAEELARDVTPALPPPLEL